MKTVERPDGFIDTFERPALVSENETANETLRQIQGVIQRNQGQTVNLQQQLRDMRIDGADLAGQTKVINRIQRNHKGVDDMGRQIGKLQALISFNHRCIAYIDWLRGDGPSR